jgi:pyrimidine operon attenuation protein/uracil phosphoribosyltransferase
MKDKILQACLPEKHIYNILKDLRVTINMTKNPYKIPMDQLFSMAARKNKKRGFLFVSKVLGKHIPVIPQVSLLIGALLSVELMKEVYGKNNSFTEEILKGLIHKNECKEIYEKIRKNPMKLPEKALFIGFAETATALGHSVFENFENAIYIHTTREKLLNLEDAFHFEEEHSHATTHGFYPLDKDLLKEKSPIILVDDEITTGKTAINIIEAIQNKFPRQEYVVVSILDWRKEEDRKRYEELEKRLGIKIYTVSLASGTIEVEGKPVEDVPSDKENKKDPIKSEMNTIEIKDEYFKKLFISSIDSQGQINTCHYLKETGRFGIESEETKEMNKVCKAIGENLKKRRKGQKTLCLGTGEFMYIPMKIAAYMGDGVVYHSSTRSPIHPYKKDDYGIKNGYSFKSPDDPSIMNYLYNIPYGHYDDCFIFFEREVAKERMDEMMDILKSLGISLINMIICSSNDELEEPSKMGSYKEKDVTFLLKDISNIMEEKGTNEREKLIQSGTHYSEMLPIEYKPTKEYIDLFHLSLNESAKKLSVAVGVVAQKIIKNRGQNTVLVSLARAGTPVGILIKRYIAYKYDLELPHYSISIIRGKGIDENAIKYILKHHPDKHIQFIDGWTGKGAITKVLKKACKEFKEKYGVLLQDDLAVLADPGYCVATFGTREDFLIASACLNSTVSGLVSRTVHRKDLIGSKDFHGAKYYKELEKEDVSNLFIETITKEFEAVKPLIEKEIRKIEETTPTWEGLKDIKTIQETFKIQDINLIKPGIGETTRVLLRRVPWKILIKDKNNPNLKHILLLAADKNVRVEIYEDMTYQCCGLIKPLKGEK